MYLTLRSPSTVFVSSTRFSTAVAVDCLLLGLTVIASTKLEAAIGRRKMSHNMLGVKLN